MRTNTKTFANRVFRQVRALGINSVRSKIVARRIVSGISHGSYSPYGNDGFAARAEIVTVDLALNIHFSGQHLVDVMVDGEFAFCASTPDLVLVNVEPVPEQVELRPVLEQSMSELYAAIGDACQMWGDVNGHPASSEAAAIRSKAVNIDPSVVAARAAYEALRDHSLALNPHAHIAYIDPALHCSYSDDVKVERGSRPSGYIRWDDVRRFYERLDREAANDDTSLANAA